MDKLNKNFLKGNVLKAEELNEIVTKLNEFATCINDNDVETSKATIQSIKNKMLVIGDTAGTAYDVPPAPHWNKPSENWQAELEPCIVYTLGII